MSQCLRLQEQLQEWTIVETCKELRYIEGKAMTTSLSPSASTKERRGVTTVVFP